MRRKIRELICPDDNTVLEFVAEVGAPGYGSYYDCPRCEQSYIVVGGTIYDARDYKYENPDFGKFLSRLPQHIERAERGLKTAQKRLPEYQKRAERIAKYGRGILKEVKGAVPKKYIKNPASVSEVLQTLKKEVAKKGKQTNDKRKINEILFEEEFETLGEDVLLNLSPTLLDQIWRDKNCEYKYYSALGMWLGYASSGLYEDDIDMLIEMAKNYLAEIAEIVPDRERVAQDILFKEYGVENPEGKKVVTAHPKEYLEEYEVFNKTYYSKEEAREMAKKLRKSGWEVKTKKWSFPDLDGGESWEITAKRRKISENPKEEINYAKFKRWIMNKVVWEKFIRDNSYLKEIYNTMLQSTGFGVLRKRIMKRFEESQEYFDELEKLKTLFKEYRGNPVKSKAVIEGRRKTSSYGGITKKKREHLRHEGFDVKAGSREKVWREGHTIYFKLWDTVIVTATPDIVTLNSGGYRTKTTKHRINKYLRELGSLWCIFQIKRKWILTTYSYGNIAGGDTDFYDGIQIDRQTDEIIG